jgi:hypothetical protein
MNLTLKTPANTTLNLRPHDTLNAFKAQPGTTVICNEGILWLTRSDDQKDYMLQPGEMLVIDQRNNVVIEALSAARVSIINHN